MGRFSYPYAMVQIPASPPYPQRELFYRPVAIATLAASNGESLRCVVLLDTGADACMFPMAMAIALKLDVLSLPSTLTGGVGTSSNVTYYDTVSVELGNGISFSAYAGFTEGMNGPGIGLLGQEGFFSQYNVHFSRAQRVFTIETP